jgi:hypothetical protein
VALSYNASTESINWSLLNGSLLDIDIDQGVNIPNSPSGSVTVSGSPNLDYSIFLVAKEGGMVRSIDTAVPLLSAPSSIIVLAGLNLPVNYGYLTIENIGGQTMFWTATSQTSNLIQILTPNGETENIDTVTFELGIDGRAPGNYVGYIEVDAGVAGTETIEVTVIVVANIYRNLLPVISK